MLAREGMQGGGGNNALHVVRVAVTALFCRRVVYRKIETLGFFALTQMTWGAGVGLYS
jgi:hypothetical protein